jgi:hypothetical protein
MMKGETVLSGAPHPTTPLEILESPAGFFLGFRDADGSPYSRETEYMHTRYQAQIVFDLIRK